MDTKTIRKWSTDRKLLRIKEISGAFDSYEERKKNEVLDELVILLLEILAAVIKEKKCKYTPLELFEGVFKDLVGGPIYKRFLETKELVGRYKSSNSSDRSRLRPKLVARGMI